MGCPYHGHQDKSGASSPDDARAVWSHRRPPPARADTLLATVDLRQHELGLTLAFERCFPAYVGLRIRREEARRCLNQAFADCSQDWDETGFALMIPITQVAAARSVFPRLAEALAEIASRPLTPCLLVAALNVTKRERLRWTKDGRLPRSGAVLVKRAVAVLTYAVSLVEELMAQPDILAIWRDQDALETRAR
jgi:hypothetical protein